LSDTQEVDFAGDIALDIVRVATATARDYSSRDVVALHLTPVTDIADYFVIASGANRRQVLALVEHIEQDVFTELGVRPHHVEGMDFATWVLLDYDGVVVHVFLDETRDYYDLAHLWNAAPQVRVGVPAAV